MRRTGVKWGGGGMRDKGKEREKKRERSREALL